MIGLSGRSDRQPAPDTAMFDDTTDRIINLARRALKNESRLTIAFTFRPSRYRPDTHYPPHIFDRYKKRFDSVHAWPRE